MTNVRESSGHIDSFNKDKITNSLLKESTLIEKLNGHEKLTLEQAKLVADEVDKLIQEHNIDYLSAPLIRELACAVMLKNNMEDIRRVYTRVGIPLFDLFRIITNPEIENANLVDNAETAHKYVADKVLKEGALLILPHYISESHLSGDIHIHDLEYFMTRSFCMDWDLRNFFFYGLDSSGMNKTNIAGAAKNAEVAILHAAKVLGSAQTNYAGGQGFYNFLTFLAPYFKDKNEREIGQLMQMFVYEIAQTMVARGGQVVFSSVQLTPGVPDLWKDKPSVYAGKVHQDEPYGMFEREVRLGFKAIIELMTEGDYNGKPFNFPKPEIGFMKEFLVKSEDDIYYGTDIPTYDSLYDLVFKLSAKFGTPYFDNMVPSYRSHGEKSVDCYQCCAYSFSSSTQTDDSFDNKLYFKDNIGFSMGAWQVVTINCPRLAYQSTTPEDYVKKWSDMVEIAIGVFKEKKKFMDIQLAANRIPFAQQKPKNHAHQSKYSLVDFDKLVWVIGMIGIDDVVRHYTGKSMHESVKSFELGQYLCLEMKSIIQEKAKEHNMNLVFARTPAETTAQRFAVADILDPTYTKSAMKIVSGDVKTAISKLHTTKNLPIYYTNGTHVPVNAECSLIDRIRIEEDFFDILDGGNIHHIFLNEWNSDPIGLKEFAMGIIRNTKIGYFAFTKVLTQCKSCFHVEHGKIDKCPQCNGTDIDYVSRVTGYLSNVSSWNAAKQQEFHDRKEHDLR
ncbi:MAG: anaerobic ribonucleoside-triphosphate reductase [Pedobacter sp.]|uniref:anaerobic ribonucleoside-triphosphate reductase n=1 Tax=Pedobacter sp. TaxID=1411316 RepID=UPI00356AB13A